MPFIKMLNNKGLRRLPCGTPQPKGDQLGHTLLHFIFCLYGHVKMILKAGGMVLLSHMPSTLQVIDCGTCIWTD